MPRRQVDTRAEILDAALELFAGQGVDSTSLREIAERLRITKAALYYHFPSKRELLTELVQPLLDDTEATLSGLEREGGTPARQVLEAHFDAAYRHRRLYLAFVFDTSALAQIDDIVPRIFSWRERLQTLLVGPDATSAEAVRCTVATGGLQDAALVLGDHLDPDVRDAAVDAALRALEG